MRFCKEKTIVIFSVFILILGCAKKGIPTGGPTDMDAPKVVMSIPDNGTTLFNQKEIKIFFDEFVTLKDLDKHLIVSPPQKNKPSIRPLSGTSKKYITITVNDTLLPNTTYSFNFGKSIVDATESNAYPNLKYIFSTGHHIDSLTVTGSVKDALLKELKTPASIFLYEADTVFSDSTVYKKSPRYVTSLDSINQFRLENIKAGKYFLVAVADKNENYRFDPLQEKIAFIQDTITVPTDKSYALRVFKEVPAFKANKPIQSTGNKLVMGYKGELEKLNVTVQSGENTIATTYTKVSQKDSIHIWYPAVQKLDSLQIEVRQNDFKENFTVFLKERKQDSLKIMMSHNGSIDLREALSLQTITPIKKYNIDKMKLTKSDSTLVAFTIVPFLMDQKLQVIFDKQPETKYVFKALPEAVEDFFGTTNKDTITTTIQTKELSSYGNLKINILNADSYPVIIELADEKGVVLESQIITKKQSVYFDNLPPRIYFTRAIYDINDNQKWDTGSYLDKHQPEPVVHFPSPIDVRVNWDIDQDFDLSR